MQDQKQFSPEIIAKVMSNYTGQKLVFENQELNYYLLDQIKNGLLNGEKLLLRTVDDLNIAEDIELCGIIHTIDTEHFLNAIREKRAYHTSILKSFKAYQYLLSIGIDLPHYLLNGQTLIECGLAERVQGKEVVGV
jgi:hypothetical protein